MVQQLSTKEEFDAFVSSPSPSIVHFSASFASSCAQMNTFLDDFVAEFSGARCAFIDAEQVAEVSLAHKIVAAPTVILFKAGKSVARVDGYKPQEVRQHWLKLGNAAQDLTSRLKELVRQKPVMVFMKGNPEAPRCGFSRQTVELLKTHNIEYGSFDILSDEEVRQGLKEFSNWPTYPQLYFEGELIGGLDVLKEELQDADFVAKLPKKKDEKAALVERLKQLISSHKLMLFMKGNPQAPQCGFSRQIIALLNDIEAEYGSFDILSDNDVRQGLKEYSSWPTYPQLYLDGELVGGLDVVREELSDPDFVSKLPKKV